METSRSNQRIDRAIAAASLAIDGAMNRTFYPFLGTFYFPWPNFQYAYAWQLWFEQHDCVSVTSVVCNGVTIPSNNYYLEPVNSGPPFMYLELNLETNAAFAGPLQRTIAITGKWSYSNTEDVVGALSVQLNGTDTLVTSVTWSTARIGVGDILRIDTEYLIVTERSYVAVGQNLGGTGVTALKSDTFLTVANGATFSPDEIIVIDSEKMLVTDVIGNGLVVERAYDGSVLAAHVAGTAIYARIGVQLARGQLGSVAAVHAIASTVYKFVIPALINQLCIAESLSSVLQEVAGYSRTIGSGDSARAASGKGLADIRDQAAQAHARLGRIGAV
jgi:hypothetical protein